MSRDRLSVLGIDPGFRSIGLGIIDADGGVSFLTTFKPAGEGCTRAGYIRNGIRDLINVACPGFVVLERPAVGSSFHVAALRAGEWIGAISVAFFDAGYVNKVVMVDASRARKFLTGNGRASKIQVAMRIYRDLGVEVETDDESDALALALYGWYSLNEVEPSLEYRREILRRFPLRSGK